MGEEQSAQSRSITDEAAYWENFLQYRERAKEYVLEIDGYLEHKTGEAIAAYLSLFENAEVVSHDVPSLPELSYAHVFALVSSEEIKARGCPYFIVNGKSVKQLIAVWKEIIFCLWEAEFSCGDDAGERLKQCMDRYFLTVEACHMMIETAGMNKPKDYLLMADCFLQLSKYEDAVALLERGVQEYPDQTELRNLLNLLQKKLGGSQRHE